MKQPSGQHHEFLAWSNVEPGTIVEPTRKTTCESARKLRALLIAPADQDFFLSLN